MINFNGFRLNTRSLKNKNNYSPIIRKNDYSNLKPLSVDTFTFRGSSGFNKHLMKAFSNEEVCRQVYENSEQVANDLNDTLNKYMGGLVATKSNPGLPIDHISIRRKTPESIREKAADILGNLISGASDGEKIEIFDPRSPGNIKREVRDIIGARIVLRNPDSEDSKKIIDSLIKAIEDKQLKITKIESYTPEGSKESLAYFKNDDLNKLKEAQDKNLAPNEKKTEFFKNKKETGYIAVHLDVDLSNPDKYVTNKDGFFGEIQIVGIDVSDLKKVEDLCYKLRDKKGLKSGNVAYKPFSTYFLKYLGKDQEIQDNFKEYTKRAYIHQRKKEPKHTVDSKKRKIELPTIEECGMQGKVPKELDFNILFKIKELCDALYSYTKDIDANS